MEELLIQVAQRGWTEEAALKFYNQYNDEIKRYIIYCLARMGFITDTEDLARLGRYMNGVPEARSRGVSSFLLDIIQGTYSDVFTELFTGNIVRNYVRERQRGIMAVDFLDYLKGIIRNKVCENVEKSNLIVWRRLSEKEILDKIVDSKKEETRAEYISIAKARFHEQVRAYLLGDYPEPIGKVVDYFFERFIEAKYPEIRKRVRKGKALLLLLKEFSKADYEEALRYTASIAPWPEPAQVPLGGIDDQEASEEELLEIASKKDAPMAEAPEETRIRRLKYWDQLIRGLEPEPSEIEKAIIGSMQDVTDPVERSRDLLCLACAKLMRESTEATKRDLRIFIIYHFSQCGPQREKPETLGPVELTLESVEGRRFTWEEASALVGKQPDYTAHARIKEKIRKEYESIRKSLYGTGEALDGRI